MLSGEDKSSLVGWNAFFVPDIGLDVVDSVCWLNIEGLALTNEGLD